MQGQPCECQHPQVRPPAADTRRAPPSGYSLQPCGAPCEQQRESDHPHPIGASGRALWPTPPPSVSTARSWSCDSRLFDLDPTVPPEDRTSQPGLPMNPLLPHSLTSRAHPPGSIFSRHREMEDGLAQHGLA
jgi:hypothetical protein